MLDLPPETIRKIIEHIPRGSLRSDMSSVCRVFACEVRKITICYHQLQISSHQTAVRFFLHILAPTLAPPPTTTIQIPKLACHIKSLSFDFALRGPFSQHYSVTWDIFWSELEKAFPLLTNLATLTFRFHHRENEEALGVLASHAGYFPDSLLILRMLSVRSEQYDQASL